MSGETREYDAKGRHLTTTRQLIVLEHGGILIGTPGMRELGLWDVSTSLDETFDDIKEFAAGCFFRNCTHTHEPRCAVKKAVEEGELDEGRFQSYLRLDREREFIDSRRERQNILDRKVRMKKRNKQFKKILKHRG